MLDKPEVLTQERCMANPFSSPFRCLAPVLALSVAACSGADEPAGNASAEAKDPPGAAEPLSIGGRIQGEGEGDFAIAVNCAAALSLTKDRLAQMSDNPQSREIALINRAEDHFENRASDASESDEGGGSSPAAAIERRRSEKESETVEQAQLAMACLRRFGTDIGA